MISSHQPGVGSSGLDAACAEGDIPVKMRIALSRDWFSLPQVSYAIVGDSSVPPRCIGNSPAMTTVLRAFVGTLHPCLERKRSLKPEPDVASNFRLCD